MSQPNPETVHHDDSLVEPDPSEHSLRIGIDATCWGLRRGFGRHSRSLIRALVEVDKRNRYVFFAEPDSAAEMPPRCEVRVIGSVGASRNHNTGGRNFLDIAKTSWAMSTEPLDLILFPAAYNFVPVLSRAAIMLVLHDATAEALPDHALHGRLARILWNAKIRLGRWQADSLIAVSDYARQQVSGHFQIPAARIQVVGEAPDPQFRVLSRDTIQLARLEKYGVRGDRRTIIHIGGFSPHKNLTYLVREYSSLIAGDAFKDVDLLLVGDFREDTFHSCYEQIVAEVARLGLSDRVRFAGYVPDSELVQLLNVASVLVIPSLNEGFGLPAVEAGACGCPVIATTASPLPSILGEGALYIDPRAPGGLRRALEEVLGSPITQARLRERGLAAVSRLSWQLEARKLLQIINTVARL